MAKLTPEELFVMPEAFATSLVAGCIDLFGIDCFNWDPQTIAADIRDAVNDKPVPAANLDKIYALITTLTTDQFYRDPIIFHHVIRALNGYPVNWNSMVTDVSSEEIAWGITEIGLNDIPDKGEPVPQFSADVAGLAGYYLKQEGFTKSPKILRFADIPDTANVTDAATIQVTTRRNEELEADILGFVKTRLSQLNQQLNSLKLQASVVSRGVTDRDYIQETLGLVAQQ